MEFPTNMAPCLPIVSPFSPESLGSAISGMDLIIGAITPTANLALFFPLRIEKPTKFVKGFLANATTLTGNVDVGIYDRFFNRLVSIGSTAQAGASALQEFDITDTTLMPGRYFMAQAGSSTGNIFGVTPGTADEVALSTLQILTQATAFPLPSTATPALSTGGAPYVPLFGFTVDTLV